MTPEQQDALDAVLRKLTFVIIALFLFSVFSLGAVLLAKMAEVRAVRSEIDRIEAHLKHIDDQNQRSFMDRQDLRKRVEAGD